MVVKSPEPRSDDVKLSERSSKGTRIALLVRKTIGGNPPRVLQQSWKALL